MSSRRYPTAELYEERERDFYRNGNRSERNYEELDLELRRGSGPDPRRSAPDFFREDYSRPTAGALALRPRDEDNLSRAGPRSSRTFDDDRDDITIRRREQSRGPPAREVEREREDIIFRRGDGPPVRSVSRPAPRQVDDDDVRFRGRGGDIDFHASRSEVSRHGRDVSAERGSIRFQEHDGNFELHAKRREYSRDGRDSSRERSSLTIRGRDRSLPPPSRHRGDLVAREREEFVIRRPRAESPPQNNREVVRDEIIIRRKEERAPSPSPSPSPPPPPPPQVPEPEIRPPIIQEIITHHRHIDHGVVRAQSKSHSRGRGRSNFDELDIDINFNRDQGSVKHRKKDMWTEITKDLVIREAIDSMGYACEETDDFFYVMEYLQYEDVLHLVEISDEIRRKRKSRIREIEVERKSIHNSRPQSAYDDRYYEHEVSFDSRRSRYR
ncbi:hypothetical protein PtrSN001A_010198 [Pyrenophora tritici-repentis]|nr:hypothetical protein PtrSN001A_010198 [Pyrenophora tritici-repentis]